MSDTTLTKTPEFEIRGEFLWFGVVLHADVRVRWCRSVRKRFLKELGDVLRGLGNIPAYAFQTPSHDPKKQKFIKDVGGVFDHYRMTGDGERAEMYRFHPLDWSKGKTNG